MRTLGLGSYVRLVDSAIDLSSDPDAYRRAAQFYSHEAATVGGGAPGAPQGVVSPGVPIGRVLWPCADPDRYAINSWNSDAMLAVYTRDDPAQPGVLVAHTGIEGDELAPASAFKRLEEGTDFRVAGGVIPYNGCPMVLQRGVAPGSPDTYIAYPVDSTLVSNGLGPHWQKLGFNPNWYQGTEITDLDSDGRPDPELRGRLSDLVRMVKTGNYLMPVTGRPSPALTSNVCFLGSRRVEGSSAFPYRTCISRLRDVLVPSTPDGDFAFGSDAAKPAFPQTRGAIKTSAVFSMEKGYEGPIAFRPQMLGPLEDAGAYRHLCRIVFDGENKQWVVIAPSQWGQISTYIDDRLETIRTNSKEISAPSFEPEPEPTPEPEPEGEEEDEGDVDGDFGGGDQVDASGDNGGGGGGGGGGAVGGGGGAVGGGSQPESGEVQTPEGWTDIEIPGDYDPEEVGIDEALDGLPPDVRERLRNQYYRDRREYGANVAAQLLRSAIKKAIARGEVQVQSGLLPNLQGSSGTGLPQIGHIKGLGVLEPSGQRYQMTREAEWDADGNLTRRGTGAGWIGIGPSELLRQRDWVVGSETTSDVLSDTMLMLYGAETSLGFGCLPGEYGTHGIASGTQISLKGDGGLLSKTFDKSASQVYDAYHQTDATTAAQSYAIPLSSVAVVIPDAHRGFAHDFLDVSEVLDVGDEGAYFDVIDLCGCA